MPDGQGDLFGEDLEKGGGLLPEVVAQIHPVHPGADEIAGVEDTPGPLKDVDQGIPGREAVPGHVVEAVLPLAGQNQLVHDLRDLLADNPGRTAHLDLAALYRVFGIVFLSSRDLPPSGRRAGPSGRLRAHSHLGLPVGRHGPQPLDDGRKLPDHEIDFLLRVVDAQAEPDGPVGHGEGHPHGPQHMGGLQRPGGAGRAGGCADPQFVHHQQNGLPFHEFEADVGRVGQPVDGSPLPGCSGSGPGARLPACPAAASPWCFPPPCAGPPARRPSRAR